MHPPLPLQQWAFLQQLFQRIMQEQLSETQLLWGKSSLPKWDRRARNSRHFGERTKAIAPCSSLLASCRAFCPMAVRHSKCCSPSQQPAGVGGWNIKAGAFWLYSCRVQYEAYAYFRMPCFCIGQCTSFRQVLAKMVATRQTRPKPGT